MKNTIATNLRTLRGPKRQKEVAAAIGIKLNRYRTYELGTREPPTSVLVKLKQFYKLASVEEILTEHPAI